MKTILHPPLALLFTFSLFILAGDTKGVQLEMIRIVNPAEGIVIGPSVSLTVEVLVKGLTSGRGRSFHYWVSLAESREGRLARVHRPKYRIQDEFDTGTVFRQSEPLRREGEAALLILRVPDATHLQFEEYLRRNGRTGDSPGLQLDPDQMVAQRIIYFSKF